MSLCAHHHPSSTPPLPVHASTFVSLFFCHLTFAYLHCPTPSCCVPPSYRIPAHSCRVPSSCHVCPSCCVPSSCHVHPSCCACCVPVLYRIPTPSYRVPSSSVPCPSHIPTPTHCTLHQPPSPRHILAARCLNVCVLRWTPLLLHLCTFLQLLVLVLGL